MNLEWDANTQLDLHHYVVFWGPESQNYIFNSTEIPPDETTYTVENLNQNTTYYFSVKAYDDLGRPSDFSNQVIYEKN